MDTLQQIKGCLLGGAVGDALGAAVEFMPWPAIQQAYGPRGISHMAPAYGVRGAGTDDTQMMLFTAEGLLRAFVRNSRQQPCHVPSVIHESLLRWLLTQDYPAPIDVPADGWLISQHPLWARRAPGTTCLLALRATTELGSPANNHSKGCGGVMRVAPCAFFGNAFAYAADSARLTHGHPSGYLAAGLFADILQRLVGQHSSLEHAVTESLAAYGTRPGMGQVKALLDQVLFYFYEGYRPTPERIAALGGGWVAEEALAIGLWCALMAGDFEEGVIDAVNHGGDSDSTGLIAGHLLGIQCGVGGIPARWLAGLELREVVERMAVDLYEVPRRFTGMGGTAEERVVGDYPG